AWLSLSEAKKVFSPGGATPSESTKVAASRPTAVVHRAASRTRGPRLVARARMVPTVSVFLRTGPAPGAAGLPDRQNQVARRGRECYPPPRATGPTPPVATPALTLASF